MNVCVRVRVRVVRIEVDLDIATTTPDMFLPFLLANSILFLFFQLVFIKASAHGMRARLKQNGPSAPESELMEELDDLSIAEADISQYVPGENSGDSSEEEDTDDIKELRLKLEKLNEFLNGCGRPGIPRQTRTWERASVRSKQRYLQSGRVVIESALKTLQPTDPRSLWEELKHSPQLDASLGINMKGVNPAYMEALAEAYNNAATWDTRRQILSFMADLYH